MTQMVVENTLLNSSKVIVPEPSLHAIGNLTGNPRVGTSDTAPVTRDTAPATGTGKHRTRHPQVSLRCDGFSAV